MPSHTSAAVSVIRGPTAATEEAFDALKRETRGRIAFYGSTPAYKRVFDLHGWDDLQPELNRLSKLGRWDEMGGLIEPDILAAFALVGEPAEVVAQIESRFAGLVDRLAVEFGDDKATTTELVRRLKGA